MPDYSNIPFSASPIVLSATPGRVAAPKDLFTSLLPLVPTAEREFARTDRVTAFLRLYQSAQKPIDRVQLAIRLRDSQDQLRANESQTLGADRFAAAGQEVTPLLTASPTPGRIGTAPTRIPASTPTPTGDQFANYSLRAADVKYPVPLSTLAPGPHLLTFEAMLGATTIRRDVRFEVR